MSQQSWREMIEEARRDMLDGPLIACTLDDEELDRSFDAGYGCIEGHPFTAWSERRVYFPGCYDGAEWVDSVPRNPCDEATGHIGGG